MKSLFAVGISVFILVAVVYHQDATAEQSVVNDVAIAENAEANNVCEANLDPSAEAEPLAKKCGFNSDCKYGKCSKGTCGSCGFDSDCNGWGKCSKGQCGSCSFASDCKGFGSCSSSKCTKSPYK